MTSARPELLAALESQTAPEIGPPTRIETPEPSSNRPRSKRAPESPLTEAGLVFGTPQYMAQELSTGTKNATRASDVFSLGIIAFEVLTGKRPFAEPPVTAKLNGRVLPRAYPFGAACETLPREIAVLLDRTLAHDPLTRPSASELAGALRDAATRLGA